MQWSSRSCAAHNHNGLHESPRVGVAVVGAGGNHGVRGNHVGVVEGTLAGDGLGSLVVGQDTVGVGNLAVAGTPVEGLLPQNVEVVAGEQELSPP